MNRKDKQQAIKQSLTLRRKRMAIINPKAQAVRAARLERQKLRKRMKLLISDKHDMR